MIPLERYRIIGCGLGFLTGVSGNILYKDYIGIIFPYSRITTSKFCILYAFEPGFGAYTHVGHVGSSLKG